VRIRTLLLLLFVAACAFFAWRKWNVVEKLVVPVERVPGELIDSLNGVIVRYNDGVNATHGRNVVDGYNVGLNYQCVEFVKRYYLEHYDHRMPNSYGHAKAFFDTTLADGVLNKDRGLLQFSNPSSTAPRVGDLVVMGAWAGNSFGHVAIISALEGDEVEIVQQNTRSTRNSFDLENSDGRYRIESDRILGWLRLP